MVSVQPPALFSQKLACDCRDGCGIQPPAHEYPHLPVRAKTGSDGSGKLCTERLKVFGI
jgi:hypothetical protein